MKTESINLFTLTEQNFNDVKDTAQVLVVKFEAAWCGACKMLQPTLTQLAQEFTGKVTFAAIDVETSPALASQFHVTNLPTVLIFREGQLLNRHIGVVSKIVLSKDINRLLGLQAAIPAV
jgi:thioredoxin 1